MKLQNIYINNRFDHVIDYDSTDGHVENFVVQTPQAGNLMPLITFSTEDEVFCIETHERTENYYFTGGEIVVDDIDSALKKMHITLTFSYKKENAKTTMESVVSTDKKDPFRKRASSVSTDFKKPVEIAKVDGLASISWAISESNFQRVLHLNMAHLNETSIELEVTLKLLCLEDFGETTAEKKLHLYISPKKNISDVILDFGSEASQMTVFNRNHAIDNTGFSDLFSNIKRELTGQGLDKKQDLDFYQYDDSNSKLFKSQFFVKKNIVKQEIDEAKKKPWITQQELLKVLTKKQEVQEMGGAYLAAPNIKLSSFGGIELPNVLLSGREVATNKVGGNDIYLYYRASISLFIIQALKEVLNQGLPMNFVSFHFLMPNVYEQQEIVKILRLLQQDITVIISEEEFSGIKGFEVTAISESDASVMGVCELKKEQNKQLDGGNYLLLDAGKGTLDFSLIKYEFDQTINQYTYKNLWRSGIIGAGNSLTYAYFIALVHQYLDERYDKNEGDVDAHDIKQFIYANILGRQIQHGDKSIAGAGDPSLLLNMMRAVDKYKKYASCANMVLDDDGASSNDLNSLQLNAFVDWLESCVDENKQSVVALTHLNYVDEMIQSLVCETMNIIDQMQTGRNEQKYKIDKVIFTGRAFNLKPFKIEMMDALKQKYQSIEEVSFMEGHTAISMKDICLVCVNPIRQGNYNRKILSEPNLLQKKVDDIVKKTDDTEAKKKRNGLKGWLSRILNLDSNDKNTNIEDSIDLSPKVTVSVNSIYEYIENELTSKGTIEQLDIIPLKGYGWTVENPEFVRFNIGGVIYLPDTGIGRGKVNIFFNGKEYIWRSENGQHGTFSARMNLENSPFLQSSFFPNFIPDNINKINLVPCVKDDTMQNVDNLVQDSEKISKTETQVSHLKESSKSQSKQDALEVLLSENNK